MYKFIVFILDEIKFLVDLLKIKMLFNMVKLMSGVM